MNTAIIRRLAHMLGVSTDIVVDEPTGLTATERLIAICKRHGATEYLSGSSGVKYMQPELSPMRVSRWNTTSCPPTEECRHTLEVLK